MKELNEYVEELLYKHQCVIIPKFGAFISNRKSARMFEDKTFVPPKRELTFNASLHSNDGLLIKHVSENSGIDYNLVEDYVNTTVEGWKKILQKGETLTLNNIGVLKQTPEGRLSFEVFEDVNYLTDSFGMSAFVPHEIAEVEEVIKPVEKQVTPTLDLPIEKEVKTENAFVNRQRREEPKRNKKRPFLAYTAIAVVGLALLAFAAVKLFGEDIVTDNANNEIVISESQIEQQMQQKLSEATFTIPLSLPTISLNAVKVKELSKSKAEAKQEIENPQKTEVVTSEVKEVKKEVVASKEVPAKESKKEVISSTTKATSSTKNKKFQVIAGAFKEEKNARTRVEQLKKLGYKNASVIGKNAKGLYQVSYAGFDNMAEAEALKKEVKEAKDQKKLDGGWILVNP
ncbi:SPOR domain-containing protein [Capnocytophaga cynodegmi]|uniref:Sporulation and cell division repeat protein n=1 Tax=Capnocytophaga cynodegmi TaxID=28189 RepID=A0A0B7H3V0_9FLAO|nr:SPOR domain-containing protein [Capnocytophaga cynodegmi]CEN32617.1 Sporulation and cell division repeat protein [Capnocytophaga cynodegmi]